MKTTNRLFTAIMATLLLLNTTAILAQDEAPQGPEYVTITTMHWNMDMKDFKMDEWKAIEKEFLDKKIAAGLYFAEPAEFKFMNDNFFRVQFQIPPSAATGEYTIKSFLIKNGKVLQVQENNLKVEQVGINAFVRSSSKDYSFIYALICIIFGVASGWFVSVLKVKP